MITGRLEANGRRLDISEDIDVPFTFAVADIKQPQNRKRSSSKTIRLPGTKNNMDFFSSTYQLTLGAIDGTTTVGFNFDPTIRTVSRYRRNGEVIFDGLMQFMDVDIIDGALFFNIVLFSNFVDLFQALGDLKIGELPWSEYDHILNFDNIKNSWDTSVIQNGSPVSNWTAGEPDGFGYYYPLVNYAYEANMRDVKDNNLFAHVYKKEIFKKCFEVASQTIVSDFIDSNFYKRQIVGFSGGEKVTISPTEVANRLIDFDSTGSYVTELHHYNYSYVPPGWDFSNPDGYYIYSYSIGKHIKVGDPTFGTITINDDVLNQVDTTDGDIQEARTGKYKVTIGGSFDVTNLVIGSTLMTSGMFQLKINMIRNGVPQTLVTNAFIDGTTVTFSYTGTLNLTVGDLITFEFFLTGNSTIRSEDSPVNSPFYDMFFADNGDWNFKIESIQAPIVNGDTVNIASFLPDMKCSEFIKSEMTLWNLYLSDPNADSEIEIEPLQDFYEETNVFDNWSKKIDYSRPQKIKPCANIEGKFYVYRFAQETDDYWHKYYRNIYGYGYGDYSYKVPSTYQIGEKIFEVFFAQTVPVTIPGSNIIIPTIVQRNDAGVDLPYKGKPRFYYIQGQRTSDSWTLRNSAVTTTTETFTEYPCVSHIDNYDTPTFDLNFGFPERVQWLATDYAQNNIFNEYHYPFIKELTGKDAKIWEVYARLNEKDIQMPSLKRAAMVNGVLYRKNIIKDFNANGEVTTFCELVKITFAKKRRQLIAKPISGTLIDAALIHGGRDTSGSSVGVGLIHGGKDSVSISANVRFGGKK